MRGRPLALTWIAAALGCNAILGNELGYLTLTPDPSDAGPDAQNVLDASGAVDASGDADGSHDANGSDADASADAATDAVEEWTPSSLGADLALWLDGDRGISTTICDAGRCAAFWADQSGHQNDAYAETVAFEPTVHPAAYNGHGALLFDGTSSSLFIEDAISLEATGDFAIFGVAAEAPNPPTQGDIFSKTAPSMPFAGPALWVSYWYPGAVDASAGLAAAQVDFYQYVLSNESRLDDAVLRVYSTMLKGSTLSVRVNDGVAATIPVSVSPGALRAAGSAASVGGRPATPQLFDGDIAEVIFVTRSVSDGEWALTYEYLRKKCAIQ